MKWIGLVLALAMLASGCSSPVEATEKEDGSPSETLPLGREHFDGRIVPTNATGLRAPQNSFKLGGWQSDSSWIKLVGLTPEGKEVKAGDVVGRFEFRGKEAKPRVQEKIDRTKAERSESSLSLRGTLGSLQTKLKRQQLEASKAELDTRKEGAIAERTLRIYEMAHKQALFDAKATQRLVGVHRRRMAAELAYRDAEVNRAEADMFRYKTYEDRYQVRAPHDGVVRHEYHRRRRRKIQKGDGMPAGMEFASVARDKQVSVEFFVPEGRRAEIKVGERIRVVAPVSGIEVEAVVREMDDFPQEIGFLRKNDELPTAREKAYVVRADFVGSAQEMKAGLEVKVLR